MYRHLHRYQRIPRSGSRYARDFLASTARPSTRSRPATACAPAGRSSSISLDAAISFLLRGGRDLRPGRALAWHGANGMSIDADEHGIVARPRTRPVEHPVSDAAAAAHAYLVHEPELS